MHMMVQPEKYGNTTVEAYSCATDLRQLIRNESLDEAIRQSDLVQCKVVHKTTISQACL